MSSCQRARISAALRCDVSAAYTVAQQASTVRRQVTATSARRAHAGSSARDIASSSAYIRCIAPPNFEFSLRLPRVSACSLRPATVGGAGAAEKALPGVTDGAAARRWLGGAARREPHGRLGDGAGRRQHLSAGRN